MKSVIETEPVRAAANAVARIRMSAVACRNNVADGEAKDAFDVLLEVIDAERDIIVQAIVALTKKEAA